MGWTEDVYFVDWSLLLRIFTEKNVELLVDLFIQKQEIKQMRRPAKRQKINIEDIIQNSQVFEKKLRKFMFPPTNTKPDYLETWSIFRDVVSVLGQQADLGEYICFRLYDEIDDGLSSLGFPEGFRLESLWQRGPVPMKSVKEIVNWDSSSEFMMGYIQPKVLEETRDFEKTLPQELGLDSEVVLDDAIKDMRAWLRNKKYMYLCESGKNVTSSSINFLPRKDNDPSLLVLPEDLLLVILGFMDAKSLCRASRVCKTFHRLISTNDEKLWYPLRRHVGLIAFVS